MTSTRIIRISRPRKPAEPPPLIEPPNIVQDDHGTYRIGWHGAGTFPKPPLRA
jgi:hypothetical protein